METAVIALKRAEEIPSLNCDYIGCDAGALILARKGIRMKYAIGDFDSVEESDLSLISAWTDELIRLNPVKDDSDSEAALRLAKEKGYGKAILYGAFGGRPDHAYVNYMLAYLYPDFAVMYGKHGKAYAVSGGRYVFDRTHAYVSFFTKDGAVISLTGMKYPLDHRKISSSDIYTLSNEVVEGEGVLIVHEGVVLVIEADD